MRLLFVEISTSDYLHRDLPLDSESQPWIVEVAAELMDWADGALRTAEPARLFSSTIRAGDRKIRDGAAEHHGITTALASRAGLPEDAVLWPLVQTTAEAEAVVSYGGANTRDAIASILMRKKHSKAGGWLQLWQRPGLAFVDIGEAATAACRIEKPGDPDGSYRRPSIAEAGAAILGADDPGKACLARVRLAEALFAHFAAQGMFEGVVA